MIYKNISPSVFWLHLGWSLFTDVIVFTFEFLGVKTDNYVITVDSYQKQIYQVEVDTGEVSTIPLSKFHKGVAIDINKFTNTIYWSDNLDHVIMSAQVDGFKEQVFRTLPNGILELNILQ